MTHEEHAQPIGPPAWGLGSPSEGGAIAQHSFTVPDHDGQAIDRLAIAAEAVCTRYGAAPGDVTIVRSRGDGSHLPALLRPVTLVASPGSGGSLVVSQFTNGGSIHPEVARQLSACIGETARQLQAARARENVTATVRAVFADVAHPYLVGADLDTRQGPASIPGGISEVARCRPGATAVSCAGAQLTYADLDLRSDRAAAGLRQLGVGSGARVGVCLDRDEHLVVTLLAVLKTGAAYVPLDPRHPAERRAYIAASAGVALVVTDDADGFGALPSCGPLELDAEPDAVAREVNPGAPAYVIFTSGSTGRPKGVVIAHRSVTDLIAAAAPRLELAATDIWSCVHSVAFDFSVWEIWGCLLTGGRLVMVSYWTARTPAELYGLLASERVTILSQTPSAFTLLADEDRRQQPGELAVRVVIFGGEPLPVRMLAPWADRHRRCRLINMFGITETTVHVTATEISSADIMSGSRSVGGPLPGWTVSVRDDAGAPVPWGVTGEIYVGGRGLAIGYLDQPDVTASRFGYDSWTRQRLFRSGDRGRLRPDGTLEHLGRLDDQVKVRGFRVELDEIRCVLLEDPAVAASAVKVRAADGPGGDQVIDAYVALREPRSAAQVRSRLATFLPDYMMPASVTVVSEIPLTANGKADTARLPPPASMAGAQVPAPVGNVPSEASDDATARMLAAWQEAFDDDISIDDSFIDLGGTSLLAVRLCEVLDRHGFPALTPKDVYTHATVTRLMAAWRAREGRQADQRGDQADLDAQQRRL